MEYWRHSWLRQPEIVLQKNTRIKKEKEALETLKILYQENRDHYTIEAFCKKLCVKYKSGRKLPTNIFNRIKARVYKDIEKFKSTYPSIGISGYEADDLAAAYVKLSDGEENILLLTVDSDWLGMVSENVSWMCMYGYSPRVRGDLASINDWSQSRLGKLLKKPSEIWEVKSEKGDASDGIPAHPNHAYKPIIDLFNPPDRYKIWCDASKAFQVLQAINYDYTPNNVHGQVAREYLQSIGINLAVKPIGVEKDSRHLLT